MPSSTLAVLWCSWMSTVGASRSRKACGALGISSERSFTYTFSMENTGWFCGWLMERPCCGCGMGRAVLRGEQGPEAAGARWGGEVVIAPDVTLPDVDLGPRAPAGAVHHFLAPLRL